MLMSRADLRIAVLCFCVIRCGAPPTDPQAPHETRTMSVKPSAGGSPVAHDWYDWYDLVAFVVTYFLIWFIFQDYLYHVRVLPLGDVRVLRWGMGSTSSSVWCKCLRPLVCHGFASVLT